jgi:general secretion pathway protein F
MQFRVRALAPDQQLLSLVLEAADEADAREQALSRRLTPLSIAPAASKLGAGSRREFDLLLFVQEFHTLVRAGLSVVEALEALAEKNPSAESRAILTRLISHVRGGMRLSNALQQQPEVFPPLLIGVVQAAEGTSELPRSLSRYLQYEVRMRAIREKVTSSAIYPAILLGVGGAVSFFLLGYVVPRFAAIYQSSGRELPLASRLLLNWGGFVEQHSLLLLGIFLCAFGAAVLWIRSLLKSGGWWQALMLLPGLKERVELFELSRVYLTLGMLLEGGIPIQRALQLARSVVTFQRQSSVDTARLHVEAGNALSEALATTGLSTPISLRLVRVGEKSGQLGPMLTESALFYEQENARWIERFTKTFEPVLMAAIGVVIGGIVVLLYMPIFDLAGSMQ